MAAAAGAEMLSILASARIAVSLVADVKTGLDGEEMMGAVCSASAEVPDGEDVDCARGRLGVGGGVLCGVGVAVGSCDDSVVTGDPVITAERRIRGGMMAKD